MKTIENEPNISRHENGNLYYVARKGGKLTVKSLKTTNLAEARRKRDLEMGLLTVVGESGLLAQEPSPPPVVLPVPLSAAMGKMRIDIERRQLYSSRHEILYRSRGAMP